MHSRRILAAGQGRAWESRGSRPRSAQPRGLAWGSALGSGSLCQPRLRVIRYGDLRPALCGHLPANPNTEITHGEILRNKTVSRPPPARSQQDFFPSFSLSSSFSLFLNPPFSPRLTAARFALRCPRWGRAVAELLPGPSAGLRHFASSPGQRSSPHSSPGGGCSRSCPKPVAPCPPRSPRAPLSRS